MLKVPQQQYIRYLREVDGCGIQEIADRVGVTWRSAKKYADRDVWNEPVHKSTVLGRFLDPSQKLLIRGCKKMKVFLANNIMQLGVFSIDIVTSMDLMVENKPSVIMSRGQTVNES